jgi:prepilin-type N-terminal cleavage/methylation domain-containing protein
VRGFAQSGTCPLFPAQKREEEVSAMSARKLRQSAFTLVELLVVVVIIGMLVGLLFPAINAARQAAIRTKCINHQKELGSAIQQYENAKQRYPGYVNQLKGVKTDQQNQRVSWTQDVSWVVVILEYLGRNDLWEQWRANKIIPPNTTPPRLKVDQLACPADSQILLTGADAQSHDALSYVVNPRIFRDRGQNGLANPTKSANRAITASDIKSQQQTVLLSEKVFVNELFIYQDSQNKGLGPGPWGRTDQTNPKLYKNQLCFFWDKDAVNKPPWWKDGPTDAEIMKDRKQFADLLRPDGTFRPLSDILGSTSFGSDLPRMNHPGDIVVVTFCDGHTDAIPANTACKEFLWGPPVTAPP